MIETVISIIAAALGALATAAPTVASAITGGQSAEEAIAAARKAAESLPVRTGDHGTWEADLATRKAGGTGAP